MAAEVSTVVITPCYVVVCTVWWSGCNCITEREQGNEDAVEELVHLSAKVAFFLIGRFDHMDLGSPLALNVFFSFSRVPQLRVRELEKSLAESRAQEQRAREIGVSLKSNYR